MRSRRVARPFLGAVLVQAGLLLGACEPEAGPPPAPLFDNLGAHHRPITTSVEDTQRYFDQGLVLVYAFDHAEAIRSFEAAAALDDGCAICYWGVALAYGPYINRPMSPEREALALAALEEAKARLAAASPMERGLIEALDARYGRPAGADRLTRDIAYADAMRALWRAYPDDADVGTLFAEALMDVRPRDYWRPDGYPHAITTEIVAALSHVLDIDPGHPGANHYYIHAVEGSPDPGLAEAAADRLRGAVPGASHLVHMPSHIYYRVGRYAEAVAANEAAIAADAARDAAVEAQGFAARGPSLHNNHFLWAAALMSGNQAKAQAAAARIVAAIEARSADGRAPNREPMLAAPLLTLVRFGEWDAILAANRPPPDAAFLRAMSHFARGLAHAASFDLTDAESELEALEDRAADRAGLEGVASGRYAVAPLVDIAVHLLRGRIAGARGGWDEAVAEIGAAVAIEDGLWYADPPRWFYPTRQSLGRMLLGAGRAAEAEEVYRADLAVHPANGWSLFGLAQSLARQGRGDEAREVRAAFDTAWARADVMLEGSIF